MPRLKVDWDAIEPHYRAGIRSLRDLGKEFGVSDAAIVKHARVNGWTRNLRGKIEAKTREKVSAAMVRAEVSAETRLTETVRVEVESEVRARIEIAQSEDIKELRDSSMLMARETASTSEQIENLRRLGEIMSEGDEGKMREVYERILSQPGRAKAHKDSVDTAIKAMEFQRKVLRLDETSSDNHGTFEQVLDSIAGALEGKR